MELHDVVQLALQISAESLITVLKPSRTRIGIERDQHVKNGSVGEWKPLKDADDLCTSQSSTLPRLRHMAITSIVFQD